MTSYAAMRFALSCLLVLGATACAPKVVVPPKTQLEIREFQSRTYNDRDTKLVMKAVINAMQDEGFIIKSADKELGFISASKEVDIEDKTSAFFLQLLAGSNARYSKNSVVEASANVSEFGKETRIRLVFQAKVVDNFGNPISANVVEDPAFYQDFFSKMDKSLFIEREKI